MAYHHRHVHESKVRATATHDDCNGCGLCVCALKVLRSKSYFLHSPPSTPFFWWPGSQFGTASHIGGRSPAARRLPPPLPLQPYRRLRAARHTLAAASSRWISSSRKAENASGCRPCSQTGMRPRDLRMYLCIDAMRVCEMLSRVGINPSRRSLCGGNRMAAFRHCIVCLNGHATRPNE